MSDRTIHLAADHAGLELKDAVREWLQNEGFEVVDHGAHTYEPLDDFPDHIKPAAMAVARDPQRNRAVIFGGSGQGEAMQANRYKHVRATVYYGGDPSIITLSREHNDANILSIGARFVCTDKAKEVIWTWLHTAPLDDEKYERRNRKLDEID